MTFYEAPTYSPENAGPIEATFLVLPGSSLMTIACTVDPLRAANRVVGKPVFSWRLVSADGSAPATSAGMAMPVSGALEPEKATDLFGVIAGFGAGALRERSLIAAIYRAGRRARAVAGLESGSWLLARAGLLDGRRATTHWEDLEDFSAAFPQIDVRPDRYVADEPYFTSSGASPTFDMMIDLVRRAVSPVAALDVASAFLYEESRGAGAAQPLVALGRRDKHDPRLIEAIRIMEGCIDRPITVAAIARRVGISARSLEAIFMKDMKLTPGAYFLALRLNLARRLVLDTRTPLADVATRAGFTSSASFSRAYRRAFSTSPSRQRSAMRL